MIVVSVGQNKANMQKKYRTKRPAMSTSVQQEHSTTPRDSIPTCDRSPTAMKFPVISTESHSEGKHDMFVSTNGERVSSALTDSMCKSLEPTMLAAIEQFSL